MKFKVMGNLYEQHFINKYLKMDFEKMSAKEIFNNLVVKCGYGDNDKIGLLNSLYSERINMNKYVEVCSVSLDVKVDSLIIDGTKYVNLEYLYDVTNETAYIYVHDLQHVIYRSKQEKEHANKILQEVNDLIAIHDSKIN